MIESRVIFSRIRLAKRFRLGRSSVMVGRENRVDVRNFEGLFREGKRGVGLDLEIGFWYDVVFSWEALCLDV